MVTKNQSQFELRMAASFESLSTRLSRFQWPLAAFIVVAVLCLGNFALLAGKSTPDFDADDYFGPEFSLIADHAKAGRLLLWDPWVAEGTPDSAEPEFGTTSPIVLLAGLLSPGPRPGFVLYVMSIWIFGPLGMLVLCRHLRCPPWGALIAALGFATSGFYTAQAQHTAHLYSVSFLPWLIWRFDVALARRSYWAAVQAGALYGLSALGGYPVYTIVTPAFLALWAIGRVWSADDPALRSRDRWRQFIFPLTAVILLTVIGVAIMSPAYAGFFTETHGYSDRSGPRSKDDALHSNIFPAGDVSTLASPYLSLLDVHPMYLWPFSDVSMRSIYSGCVVVVLAFLALLASSKWRRWLFGLALLSLCCAVAYQLPLRGWLYDFVPPTRYFRNAASFRTYAILLICILAALGTKDLANSTGRDAIRIRRRFFLCSVTLAIIAAWTFALVVHLSSGVPVSFGRPLPPFSLAISYAIVIWSSTCAIAFLLWRRRRVASLVYGLLVVVAILDSVTTLQISSVTMYSPAALRFWRAMDSEHVTNLSLSANGLFRQLEPPDAVNLGPHTRYHSNRNIPLRVPVATSFMTMTNRFYSQITEDPLLVQMALGSDRIWFVSDAPVAPPTDGNFAVYAGRVRQQKGPVVILHSRQEMEQLSAKGARDEEKSGPAVSADALPSATRAEVTRIAYWPNSLSFNYFAREGGWLIVTDRWAPGWTVKVNGKLEEILGADFIYRAVRVEPGDNVIRFKYRPWGWPYLLILSWGTLLIVAVCQVVRVARRVKPRVGSASGSMCLRQGAAREKGSDKAISL